MRTMAEDYSLDDFVSNEASENTSDGSEDASKEEEDASNGLEDASNGPEDETNEPEDAANESEDTSEVSEDTSEVSEEAPESSDIAAVATKDATETNSKMESEPGERSDSPPSVSPATSTFRWSPAGDTCASCGTAIRGGWIDDDAVVCTDCKSW